jgi:hypothetical protein
MEEVAGEAEELVVVVEVAVAVEQVGGIGVVGEVGVWGVEVQVGI